jgi:hypothetical protein
LRARRGAERQNPETGVGDGEPALADRLFRGFDRAMFNKILDEEGLKFDRDGQR